MICKACGGTIAEGAKFCEHCGAKVDAQVSDQESQPIIPQGTAEETDKSPKKSSPNPGLKIVGFVILVAIVFIRVIAFATSRKETIRLNDYITISCSGYDSLGSATYEFDEEAFLEDYSGSIKLSKSAEDAMGDWVSLWDDPAELFVSICANGTLSQTNDLSNGDEIVFSWDFDDAQVSESFNVELDFSDVSYAVSGLTELDTFDAFSGIEVVFSGASPAGYASVINNSTDEATFILNYEVSPRGSLSNGMNVTVSIDSDSLIYLAENYGLKPSEKEKEYTVEGLPRYVTHISEIPQETMEAMESQIEDVLAAQAARDWPDGVTMENITYLGSYLLVPKNSDTSAYTTKIYLVYKLQSHEYCEERGVDNYFDFYSFGYFSDIMQLSDGSYSVDLSDYTRCRNTFYRELKWYYTGSISFNYTLSFDYDGYESLDSLFRDCVTSQIDEFTYESTVEDIITSSSNDMAEATEPEGTEGTDSTDSTDGTDKS